MLGVPRLRRRACTRPGRREPAAASRRRPPPAARARPGGRRRCARAEPDARRRHHAQPRPPSTRPTDERPADVDAARRIDGLCNRWFLDPSSAARYPADVLGDSLEPVAGLEHVHDGDLAVIAAPIDVARRQLLPAGTRRAADPPDEAAARRLAARAGRSACTRRRSSTGLPQTAMGWEIEPDGLARAAGARVARLRRAARSYVTENGAAFDDVVDGRRRVDDPDAHRATSTRTSRGRRRAIAEGVDAARLLRLVAARQLRVGVRLRQALRHRPRRLRHADAHGEGERSLVRSGGHAQRDRRGVAPRATLGP